MNRQLDLSIIVPAYNEAGRIAATIAEVQRYCDSRQLAHEIIVAADGDDGTRERAAEAAGAGRVQVIGRPGRHGKGRGIREAMPLASGEIVGFIDADQKTPIEEFDKFRRLFADGYDVVIGSRAMRESRIERPQPLYRRLGSRGFAAFLHVVIGLKDFPDTQCGFKFFRRAIAKDLFARQRIDGYMFDVEVLHLAQQGGCRIAQVPVRWRDDGDSRLDVVAGNFRNLLDVLQIRWGRSEARVADVPEPKPTREVGG